MKLIRRHKNESYLIELSLNSIKLHVNWFALKFEIWHVFNTNYFLV